jgi:hypothetical protein
MEMFFSTFISLTLPSEPVPGRVQEEHHPIGSPAEVAGIESLHPRARSLTPPGVGEALLELIDGDRRQPDQDGRKAVMVRLGKELLRIRAEEHLLLLRVRDAGLPGAPTAVRKVADR